jgi:hypothetical protein
MHVMSQYHVWMSSRHGWLAREQNRLPICYTVDAVRFSMTFSPTRLHPVRKALVSDYVSDSVPPFSWYVIVPSSELREEKSEGSATRLALARPTWRNVLLVEIPQTYIEISDPSIE